MKTNVVIQGDCLEILREIPDGSVDLVCTDPPYGTIKGADLDGWDETSTEWDTPIDHDKMLHECERVLRKNGCLILFGQDPYTSKIMTDTHGNMPFSYRYTWIKDHFANALIAKKSPVNYTEDVCVFYKRYDTSNQHPLRQYSKAILDYIDKPLVEIFDKLGDRCTDHFFRASSMQFSLCTEGTYNQLVREYQIDRIDGFLQYKEIIDIDRTFNRTFNLPENSKYKSNVLQYKKDYTGQHPTQKPVSLMADLIMTHTNAGDLVLDFTCGSGTTLVAAKNLGRRYIGIEISEAYCEVARTRLAQQTLELR